MKFNICEAISLLEGVSSNEEGWEKVESKVSCKRSSTTIGDSNFDRPKKFTELNVSPAPSTVA